MTDNDKLYSYVIPIRVKLPLHSLIAITQHYSDSLQS